MNMKFSHFVEMGKSKLAYGFIVLFEKQLYFYIFILASFTGFTSTNNREFEMIFLIAHFTKIELLMDAPAQAIPFCFR